MNVYRKLKVVLDAGQKRRVAGLIVMIIFSALLETLGISVIIPLVSAVVSPETITENESVLAVLSLLHIQLPDSKSFVRTLLLLTMAVFIFKNLYLLLLYHLQAGFIARSQRRTSERLMYDYLNRPYEFYLNSDNSVIIRAFSNDVPHVFELLKQVMLLITELVVSICICIFLFIVDFKITLAIAVLLVVLLLFIVKLLKPMLGRLGQLRVNSHASTIKYVQEGISGIKDVKVNRRENYFLKSFSREYEKLSGTDRGYTVLNQLPRLIIESVCIAAMLGYMFVLVSAGGDIMQKLPELSAFAMAAVRLMPSVNRISSYLSAIAFFEPSLIEVCDKLDLASLEDAAEFKEAEEKLHVKKEILLTGICYHYPNSDKEIFSEAELRIPEGSSVGVVGVSGAGKTTIVDILLGLLKPQKGSILVDGKQVDPSSAEWLAGVGYIAQNIFMRDASVRDNVAYGVFPEDVDDERVWEALEEAQLKDFVKDLPEGLDTSIGEAGIRVSGGQRQRIGIARALYRDPELLVFDEATSALDNETEAAIMDAINSLKGKKTMVIIAHRLKTIENCDIIYRVENGKIIQTRGGA